MRLFRMWTVQQCTDAILALEEGLALGIQSIQYPTGGGTTSTTPQNAMIVLEHLYARLDTLQGRRPDRAIRQWKLLPKRGW